MGVLLALATPPNGWMRRRGPFGDLGSLTVLFFLPSVPEAARSPNVGRAPWSVSEFPTLESSKRPRNESAHGRRGLRVRITPGDEGYSLGSMETRGSYLTESLRFGSWNGKHDSSLSAEVSLGLDVVRVLQITTKWIF